MSLAIVFAMLREGALGPTATGAQVSATMMSNGDTALDYASGPGWQAVRIPYQGDRLSMGVMLPSGHPSPVSLLSPQVLSRAGAGFTRMQVQLNLPRWNIGSRLDLDGTLQKMGLARIFEPGGFGALSPDRRLAVDQVVQQATIAVGEKGTAAARARRVRGDRLRPELTNRAGPCTSTETSDHRLLATPARGAVFSWHA